MSIEQSGGDGSGDVGGRMSLEGTAMLVGSVAMGLETGDIAGALRAVEILERTAAQLRARAVQTCARELRTALEARELGGLQPLYKALCGAVSRAVSSGGGGTAGQA